MTTPTKEQIEKIAFELFNADYGLQMVYGLCYLRRRTSRKRGGNNR